MLYPDFSYYNPTSILKNRVPFIKVKTIAANEGLTPYILNDIENTTDYPVDLIVKHMSRIDLPDYPYLLGRKLLDLSLPISIPDKKIAVHLHVFYVDLLAEFLHSFKSFHFSYDLFITTDSEKKKNEILGILEEKQGKAEVFHVTVIVLLITLFIAVYTVIFDTGFNFILLKLTNTLKSFLGGA